MGFAGLFRRRIVRGAAVGLLCGLAGWLLSLNPLLQGLEEWCQDASFAYRGVRPSSCRVAIVALDEPSLRAIPRPLAFTSDELAKVLSYLGERGAAAVGVDVMVPEGLDRFAGLGEGPKRVGEVAAGLGTIVLPVVSLDEGRSLIRPLKAWRSELPELPGREVVPLGLVGLTEDDDHFVRRQAPLQSVAGRTMPHLTVAMLREARRAASAGGGTSPDVIDSATPLDPLGRLRINFVGPTGTIPRLSFRDVVAAADGGPPPRDHRGRPFDLKDAFIIVGATDRSLGDLHSTPYSNGTLRGLWSRTNDLMPGPEIHANLLATMVDRAFITRPWWLVAVPAALTINATLGVLLARMGLGWGAVLTVGHHLAWKAACVAALILLNWRVEMVAMFLAGPLCYAATFALRWRVLRNLLGIVKGEAIARALEDDPRRLRLLGEMREVSVLFADIRNFTTFSESRPAPEVVALLNAYFAAVVPAIEENGGVLDKYIGDGIMATFGALGDWPDHAERAATAAAAMAERTRRRASTWAALKFEGMEIGVGVQTGPAVVGTVGSPGRMDYTAIGATVNAASRIESATKDLKAAALIGAPTRNALSPEARARLGVSERAERVVLKGIGCPVEVYRLGEARPLRGGGTAS